MTDRAPTEATSLDRYASPPLDWSRAHTALAAEPDPNNPIGDLTWFLGTVRPDGRPHAAPFGALWHDGDIYIASWPGTQKSRNLAANPACTVSVKLPGIDLVLEGEALRLTDHETLKALAGRYRAGGWPAEVEGDALTAPFSAPSAGPPPYFLYRFTFHTAFGVATAEPFGATRWRFAS